jgi:hypothetical protein
MGKKARWIRNEMGKKSFIFGNLDRWWSLFLIAIKKPSLKEKDWVIRTSPFTAFHRRLDVKHIQAGFLAYGSSYSLPLPTLTLPQAQDFGQWIWQVSSPITAAWPSPALTGFPFRF